MPNWCLNKLTVQHDDPSMIQRFIKAYNAGKTCNEFIPVPEGYYENGQWYDWCVDNWGTKWDVGADEGTEKEEQYGLKGTVVGNQVCCSFDSAWSPPIPLYDKLIELGYKVEATYFEPGMSYCGIYEDGHDTYVDYRSKREIPMAVWNDFDCGSFFEEEVGT